MRKIKEVLRLKFAVGLGLRQIARSCSIGLGTVHEYPQRAEAAGVTWPLGEDWDEDPLEAALFGGPPRSRPAVLPMPDFAELHQQRQQPHPHLTQQLLWEEYRQANPDGYRYSRFCELSLAARGETGGFHARWKAHGAVTAQVIQPRMLLKSVTDPDTSRRKAQEAEKMARTRP